jgi:hypothetical protein
MLVEILGRYSNLSFQHPKLESLLAMTPDGCPTAPVPSPQRRRQFQPEEIKQMIEEYQSGVTAAVVAKLHEWNELVSLAATEP